MSNAAGCRELHDGHTGERDVEGPPRRAAVRV